MNSSWISGTRELGETPALGGDFLPPLRKMRIRLFYGVNGYVIVAFDRDMLEMDKTNCSGTSKKHILTLLLSPTKIDSFGVGSLRVAFLTLLYMLKHQLTKPNMKIIHI